MMLTLLCFALVLLPGVYSPSDPVSYIADNLKPSMSVITNFGKSPNTLQIELKMENTGNQKIETGDWEIYFCYIRLMEPSHLDPKNTNGVPIGDDFILFHIDGNLYKLVPTEQFVGIDAQDTLVLNLNSGDWMVARTDVMPNWYVVNKNGSAQEAQVIKYTEGEELNHVGLFNTPEKWKRTQTDVYDPPNPFTRYDEYVANMDWTRKSQVIPTPLTSNLIPNEYIKTSDSWKMYAPDSKLEEEIQYLEDKTGWGETSTAGDADVLLHISNTVFTGTQCENSAEAYQLLIGPDVVEITGASDTAVFYGIQTMLAMKDLDDPPRIQQGNITDCPRFGFRGLMVDVSRNFFDKDSIVKVLGIMAMYKLNKFHFHLSDDEGWRLRIPGLDELTDIGARRCHNPQQDECIIPQLGSHPSGNDLPGTGFYTVEEYKDILTEAKKLHIEVIPEFDMPGHGHAAIKAMEARYNRLKDTNINQAEEYLLSDFEDTSAYYTAQYFKYNAINPCLSSTMTFIEKVIHELKMMHEDAGHPLEHYHFGGDEVPATAWIDSPVCNTSGTVDNDELKRLFAINVSNIVATAGNISLGSWEDGVMNTTSSNPFPITDMGTTVYTNCWSNVWEWGNGERAYKFANADYKVVLSHATHLYFDHPHEPHPHERGYYWATRFAATEKTFGYIPDDIYANIDTNRMGEPLTYDDVCSDGCEKLQEDKKQNIIGMQGQLFSETVRNSHLLHGMILPRMLALAERAWYKAPWESVSDVNIRNEQRRQDFENFASLLGHHELERLGTDVSFHLRPPAARLSGGTMSLRAEFPGLTVQYKIDENEWMDYETSPVDVSAPTTISVKTKAPGTDRFSMEEVFIVADPNSSLSIHTYINISIVLCLFICFLQ